MDDLAFNDAMNDLNKVILLAPYNASAYYSRAILKSKIDDFNGALNDYNIVIKLNPKNILAYYNRGGIKYKNADLNGALSDYDKAIELFPDFADAYYNRSFIKRDLNDIKGSIEDYKKVASIQKTYQSKDSIEFSEDIHLMKMLALSDDFNTYESAKDKVQYKQTDIELQPIFSITLLPVYSKKIRTYDTRGKQYYDGSVITLVNTKDSIDIKKVQNWINVIDTAIREKPNDAFNYLHRAILNTTFNKFNSVFSDYEHAISIDSNNAMIFFSRANTRFKLLELLHSLEEDVPQTFIDKSSQDNTPQQTIYETTCEMIINDYTKTLVLDSNFTYAWFNRANAKFS